MFGGASSFNSSSSGNGIWLGVTDLDVEGIFKYDSDGTLLPFTPVWDSGEPNVSTDENCVQLLRGSFIIEVTSYKIHTL